MGLLDVFRIDVYNFLVSIYRIFLKTYLSEKTRRQRSCVVCCHFSLERGRGVGKDTYTMEYVYVCLFCVFEVTPERSTSV